MPMLLKALVAVTIIAPAVCATAAQTVTTTQPVAPSQRPTVQSAPTDVVYTFFFRGLAGFQRQAAKLEAEGKDAAAVRERYRKITALNEPDFAFLAATAEQCVSSLAENDRTADGLVRAANGLPDRTLMQQLAALRRAKETAVTEALSRMRAHFDPQAFAILDKRIRHFTVARMFVQPLDPRGPRTRPEGQ